MVMRILSVLPVLAAIMLHCGCDQPPKSDTAGDDLPNSLVRAAWRCDTARIAELVAAGADLNLLVEEEGLALLFHAAANNQPDMVGLLLDAGVRVDQFPEPAPDNWSMHVLPEGRQLVFTAAEHGSREVVALLLERGVAIDTRDYFGLTPLHYAYAYGQDSVVELLQEQGADPQAMSNAGYTCNEMALFAAARSHDVPELTRLLDDGYRPDVELSPGITPLNQDETLRSPDCVRLLLAAGADPDIQGPGGLTPLHRIAGYEYTEVEQLLIEAGAIPETTPRPG